MRRGQEGRGDPLDDRPVMLLYDLDERVRGDARCLGIWSLPVSGEMRISKT